MISEINQFRLAMATLTVRFKNGFWYFRKGYFSQLFHELKNSLRLSPRANSLEWCRKLAIQENELFEFLGIQKREIKKDFPQYLKFAQQQMNNCPVEMGEKSSAELVYNLVLNFKPKYAVETGVAYGSSTLGILLGIQNFSKAHLWSVDMPIPNLRNEGYVGCMVHKDLKARWSLIRMPDINGLPLVLEECPLIDFFHYDSDRSYRGRLNTLKSVWYSLRMGGYIFCCDIQSNKAFKDFTEFTSREPIVIEIGKRYFGLIRK